MKRIWYHIIASDKDLMKEMEAVSDDLDADIEDAIRKNVPSFPQDSRICLRAIHEKDEWPENFGLDVLKNLKDVSSLECHACDKTMQLLGNFDLDKRGHSDIHYCETCKKLRVFDEDGNILETKLSHLSLDAMELEEVMAQDWSKTLTALVFIDGFIAIFPDDRKKDRGHGILVPPGGNYIHEGMGVSVISGKIGNINPSHNRKIVVRNIKMDYQAYRKRYLRG